MRQVRGRFWAEFGACFFLGLALGRGAAAAPGCVETADPEDAGVQVLRGEGGLVVFAEAGAMRSSAAQVGAHPGAIQLDEGALLIASPAAAFAALTRDAVVSGQG
jgi:hypothetical protein